MINKIRQSILFKNTFIYTLMELLNKGIPFLLLPVLTVYLTTDDYGMVATYNTYVSLLVVFIGLSMNGAVGVNFFHLNRDELQVYIGNVLFILFSSTTIVLILILIFADLISTNFLIPKEWLFIGILIALMQMLTTINLVLWRNEQRAKPYAVYEFLRTVTNIAISLLLIITFGLGWFGRISGSASTTIFFGVLSIFFLFNRGYVKIKYNTKDIIDALKFGVPLIPHNLSFWLRTGIDIFFITTFVGLSQTGIYSVGYQFGVIIGILAGAFNNAYSPYLFEKLKNITDDKKIQIVKFTYLYFISILLFAIAMSGFFAMLIPYFLPESYHEARKYIFWISLAYAFNGMYYMVVNYIFYVKKTYLLSATTITMSVFHVLLSFILIQYFDAMGAAYATLISFFLTFLIVWRLSAKVYDMPWMLWRLK